MAKRKEAHRERTHRDFPPWVDAKAIHGQAQGQVKKLERSLSDKLYQLSTATPPTSEDDAENYLADITGDGSPAVATKTISTLTAEVEQLRAELELATGARAIAGKRLTVETRKACRQMKKDRLPERHRLEQATLKKLAEFRDALRDEFLHHHELHRLGIDSSGTVLHGPWVDNLLSGKLRDRKGRKVC